jgi:hypothetical protein
LRSTDTPIRPLDIESDNAFLNAFGQREPEVAAYWVVRFCQARRSWKPFLFDKLVRFCLMHDASYPNGVQDSLLEGLTDLVVGKFVLSDQGIVTLTTTFVARCYERAPIPGLPRKRRQRQPRKHVKSRYERLMEDESLL